MHQCTFWFVAIKIKYGNIKQKIIIQLKLMELFQWHILFEAHDLGLGSVVVRSFQTEKIKEVFKIPENMVPVALLPIGYPKEGSKPSKLHFKKNDIKDFVEYL